MKQIAFLASLGLVGAGCSVVFDPSVHMTGGMDGGTTDGSTTDGGTTDGGTDGGPPMIALGDFCPMLAEVYCTAAEMCCELPTMFDRPRCLSEIAGSCASIYGLTATRDEIDYDPVAAYESFARGRALVEVCSLEIQDFLVQRDGLFGGIVGTVGGGVACTPAGASDTDVTVAVLSCTGSQVCRQLSDTYWNCQEPAPDGAPCRFGFDCQNGRCEQLRFLAARMCGPGEAGGSPCNPFQPDECMSLACAWDAGVSRFQCAPLTQNNAYCTYASPRG